MVNEGVEIKIRIHIFSAIVAAATFATTALLHAAAPAPSRETPSRVVCLAPSYAETMAALGLADRIVGVTTSSDHIAEIKNAERVGLFMRPSLEKILSLRPDLVFASKYSGQQALVDKLRSLKIEVVILEMNQIKDIQNMATEIGSLFNVSDKAEALNKEMSSSLARIKALTKDVERPRIYVEAGSDPLFTCGPGSFIHELLELAGAENIAGDMKTPYPRVSSELIIRRDPQIILLPYMAGTATRDDISKRGGWSVISAIKTGRIYDDLGSQTITIPSPRLILEGLPELLQRIHPARAKHLTEHHANSIAAPSEPETEKE